MRNFPTFGWICFGFGAARILEKKRPTEEKHRNGIAMDLVTTLSLLCRLWLLSVSQKRPVESWTEGVAVRVKLCKACAGAGTGGVWMQSSAKSRNWWMDLSYETPSTETSLIREHMYSTCSDACLSLRGMKKAHVCSRPPCSILGQKTVGEMHRWLYLILWEESDQRDWRDGAFRPPPPFGKFSCANCKIRAMAHQHAFQDSEDLIKYKTCDICLWLKIRWLECYMLPHGI